MWWIRWTTSIQTIIYKEKGEIQDGEKSGPGHRADPSTGLWSCFTPPVIEYNTKYDMDGNISAFKLCIVGDIPDKRRMLTRIFDEVDSDIPYDVLLYTDEQFRELTEDDGAFASHVNQKGRVRYEK